MNTGHVMKTVWPLLLRNKEFEAKLASAAVFILSCLSQAAFERALIKATPYTIVSACVQKTLGITGLDPGANMRCKTGLKQV